MLDPQAPISPGQTEGRRRHSMVLSIGSIPIYVKSATRLKHDGGKRYPYYFGKRFRVIFFVTGFPLSYRFPGYR